MAFITISHCASSTTTIPNRLHVGLSLPIGENSKAYTSFQKFNIPWRKKEECALEWEKRMIIMSMILYVQVNEGCPRLHQSFAVVTPDMDFLSIGSVRGCCYKSWGNMHKIIRIYTGGSSIIKILVALNRLTIWLAIIYSSTMKMKWLLL